MVSVEVWRIMKYARGQQKSGPLFANPSWFVDFVFCRCWFQASEVLVGGQDTQSSGPGNRLRPVVGIEFAVDIAGVGLNCMG